MLFSYKLLSKLVDLHDISVDQLIDRLTFTGFEVEGFHQVAQASKLIIGQVISCQNHPDSDHLHILKVNAGQEGVLDIVCGAPNVALNKKVIVAMVGCELKAIGETIKPGVIRGATSNGMCCSLVELGVDKATLNEEDINGIHLLDDDAPIGERNVLGYLGLDDTILDINVLPNRPDCLCHFGLAREIGSLFLREVASIPSFDFNKKTSYQVSSETSSCKQFNFVEANTTSEGKTPKEIVNYLRSLGYRSVSLIVDLGNFSMILNGQPLHMYDLDKVHGKKLTVKDNFQGKFTALDDQEYDLINGDIVIEDEDRVCCLGGVMGGKEVAIDQNTTHIGIEAANFYHAAIRHTSSRLGLISDSSALFIKGVNPYISLENLSLTMELLNRYLPSFSFVGFTSYNEVKPLEGSFKFSLEKLNHRLGASYSKKELQELLNRFHLNFHDGVIDFYKYRLDLIEQCDIDEEMFRTVSQESINKSLKDLPITLGHLSENQQKTKNVREFLIENGLDQIISFTLVSKELDNSYRVFNNDESYHVMHPITEDHAYVRSDILSSLVDTLHYNLDRKNINLGLFEISNVEAVKGHVEYLSIGLTGEISQRGLLDSHKVNFYDMKGYVEGVLSILGLDNKRYKLVRSTNPNFHPYKSADIYIGKDLMGTFGEINPSLHDKEMVLCELNLTGLLQQKSSKMKAKPLMNLQPIRRDLAFKLLDSNVTCDAIIAEIKKSAGKYLTSVNVFDVFSKDNETSYAFALNLVKEDKSFTDAEINSLLNTIILNVTHKLKVELKA